jgi:hypothetical protein
MNSETKKLALIEKLLLVSDDAVLEEVEAILSKKGLEKKERFRKFAGKIEEKDLAEMEQIIEQGCEQINSNDWK